MNFYRKRYKNRIIFSDKNKKKLYSVITDFTAQSRYLCIATIQSRSRTICHIMKKRYLYLLYLLMSVFAVQAQSPGTWYREYAAGVAGAREVRPTSDGGAVIVTSRVVSFKVLGQTVYLPMPVLIKTDAQGKLQWSRFYDGLNNLKSGLTVAQTQDNGYVIGGTQYTLDANNEQDVFLFKTDANGDPVAGAYAESFSGFESAVSLCENKDGDYVFLKVTDLLAGSKPGILVKVKAFTGNFFNPGGTKVWSIPFDHAYSAVRPLADGGYLLAGDTIPNPADSIRRLVITKIDAQGNKVWHRRYDQFRAGAGFMEVLPDQGAFMCFQYGFARSDAHGNILWADTSLPFTRLPYLESNLQPDIFSTNPRMTLATDVVIKPDGRCIGTGVIREGPWTHIFLRQYAPGDGKVEWTRIFKPFQWNTDTILPSIAILKDGGLVVCGHRSGGGTFLLRTDANGLNGNVSGRVVMATAANCQGSGTPPPFNWIIRAVNAKKDEFFATTDSMGYYGMWLPEGKYELSAVPPNLIWKACEKILGLEIDLDDANKQSGVADFTVQPAVVCPLLHVEMATNGWRKGYTSPLVISYCNYGSQMANNAYLRLDLDEQLQITESPRSYTRDGDGWYRFEVGNVAPGQCEQFNLMVRTNEQALTGQTLCAEVHIFPDNICTPFNDWLLALSDTCTGDSVKFIVRNVSGFNMGVVSNYIIVEDNILRDAGSVKLDGMQEQIFALPVTGGTYAFTVQQNPGLPSIYGDSLLTAVVEGCGTTANFSIGYYNQFSLRDGSYFKDKACQPVRSSFDPNDKNAHPEGVGPGHLLPRNTDIEYFIRFQNTGNDTAFTVMITDTLSEYLDPATLQPGPASHPYDLQIIRGESGDRQKLRFVFNNILLPDSTTNEPASHGFVKYRVGQKPGLAAGTAIHNRAAIFFDFNEPVITNTIVHVIASQLVQLHEISNGQISIQCSPNPVFEKVIFEVGYTNERYLKVQIFDAIGRLVVTKRLISGQNAISRTELSSGLLFFVITAPDGKVKGRGKIVVE